MNKKILFLICLILFIFTIGSVAASDENVTFSALQTEINGASSNIELTHDYIYDNSTDFKLNNGIIVNKTNFTINGNGHTVDGAGQARIFNFQGNVTLKNIRLINGFNKEMGGAIFSSYLHCENVTFVNNSANDGGALVGFNVDLENCEFSKNHARAGAGV